MLRHVNDFDGTYRMNEDAFNTQKLLWVLLSLSAQQSLLRYKQLPRMSLQSIRSSTSSLSSDALIEFQYRESLHQSIKDVQAHALDTLSFMLRNRQNKASTCAVMSSYIDSFWGGNTHLLHQFCQVVEDWLFPQRQQYPPMYSSQLPLYYCQ